MESVNPTIRMEHVYTILKLLGAVIIIGLLITGIVSFINYTIDRYRNTSTPAHNARIVQERIAALEDRYEHIRSKIGGFEEIVRVTPENQRALINYRIMTVAIAGYMGPAVDGVFAEDVAIERAFNVGARHFILPIDYMDDAPAVPRIIVRDGGVRVSNNTGSISAVIRRLAEIRQRSADPIIITLYFHRLPPGPKESLEFMASVAKTLTPLAPYHMGLTSEGDYRRQGMADTIFTRDIGRYEKSVLIFTNADTTPFRQEGLRYSPQEDLDLWTHLRILSDESAPQQTQIVHAVMNSLSYYTSIPADSIASTQDKTRLQFTIAHATTPDLNSIKKAAAAGVQSIPFDVFTDIINGTRIADTLGFVKSGFALKDAPLRYKDIPPVVGKAVPASLNANGGNIVL
jgi:hypothetical protein